MRQFTVIVRRNRKRSLAYPPLDGEKALTTMRRLQERGFETVAETTANGITEQLTLDEMSNLYGF